MRLTQASAKLRAHHHDAAPSPSTRTLRGHPLRHHAPISSLILLSCIPRRSSRSTACSCQALDAAQPFDAEAIQRERAALERRKEKQLVVGIVGFGPFGQFLAKRMVKAGHRVLATSRSPYADVAKELGVAYYQDVNDFCEEHPEVVILCSSILSTELVLSSIPLLRLKRSTLFVDVLSVKVFPKQLMLERLPPEFDILCTHPMFGPTSGAGSWTGLNFQFEKVRTQNEPARLQRVENVLNFFAEEGCNMVEMTCEEHDEAAASTQFITHTVGRMLANMELKGTRINTKGFDALLNLVNQTCSDSFELYYGLFLYNQNATDELERLEQGLEKVKKGLFSKLHDIARQEIFPEGMASRRTQEPDKEEKPSSEPSRLLFKKAVQSQDWQ